MQPIRPVQPVPPYPRGPMPPRTPLLALLGFGSVALGAALPQVLPLLALVALTRYGLALGIVCGLVAAGLGIAALVTIARQPTRYEGRPMAIAALVLGLLEATAYGAFGALEATGILQRLFS